MGRRREGPVHRVSANGAQWPSELKVTAQQQAPLSLQKLASHHLTADRHTLLVVTQKSVGVQKFPPFILGKMLISVYINRFISHVPTMATK